MTPRKILPLLPLAALASCTVGPDYHTPATSLPADWSRTASTQPAAATQPAPGSLDLAQWWNSFNDPALTGLIQSAAASNLDLKIASARIAEARANLGIARSYLGPSAGASGSATANLNSGNTQQGAFIPDRTYGLYQAGFDASWEIDLFGGNRRNIQASAADLDSAVENHNDALVSLLAEVARNYVALRTAQRQLEIARENIVSQTDTLHLAQARLDAGLVTEIDVTQATATLRATQSQLPNFEAAAQTAIHHLSILTARQPRDLVAALSIPTPIPLASSPLDAGLPSDLLRRRPDIRSAERQLAAATARIGVATAELFPKFNLLATTGLQSISASNFFSAGSAFGTIGPAMTWRLFESGRLRSAIKVQNAQQEQALLTYEQTILRSLEDVENALVNLQQDQLRTKSLEEVVAANQRTVDLANERYTKGIDTFLQVRDAQRSLYIAQDQLVQAQANVTLDWIALYKSLGGGWDAPK